MERPKGDGAVKWRSWLQLQFNQSDSKKIDHAYISTNSNAYHIYSGGQGFSEALLAEC